MNVPFVQNTTFTGLISTRDHGTSLQWYDAFLGVQALSSSFQTLTFNENTQILAVVPGNSVSLASLSDVKKAIAYAVAL
jgi:hypothetical protein